MKRRVRLFIGGMEADFTSTPDILYNFKVDDLQEPAAIRNSYSKTISLPSTKRNSKIFDNFFANDYYTSGRNFDASKKTEFTIYVDSDVFETGYCKLDKVVQNKHTYTYEISLYGSLGELFFNLEYSDNPSGEDNRRKISDLEFFPSSASTTPIEIGFTINKETLVEAWDHIDDDASQFSCISFAPAYNGLPQDFDANKVLMNIGGTTPPNSGGNNMNYRPGRNERGSAVITATTVDGKTYTTYGGYALAELTRDYTGAEMREFRSYLQRPVLSVKKTLEAICRPENNGGFEVEFDSEWATPDNPYWESLYCTLPMLSTLEYNASEVATGVTIQKGAKATGTTVSGVAMYYEDTLVSLSETGNTMAFDASVTLSLDVNCPSATGNSLSLCALSNSTHQYYPAAIFAQLVAYDILGNPVAGSDSVYLTSAYGTRRSADGRTSSAYFIEPTDWDYTQPYGNGCSKSNAHSFEKVQAGKYRWAEDITLTANNVPEGSTLKILITKVYGLNGNPSGYSKIFEPVLQPGQPIGYITRDFTDFDITINSSRVSFKTNSGIRTGASFSKKQLLDTDFSPLSFLVSYMKIFGLYAVKDPIRKKVNILTRKNFFHRDEIVDIQDKIDRTNLQVTPLVFDSKWYDWNLEADESEYGKAYENTFGKPYGEAKVNTGYNFNRDTKNVLEGNIFRNAVQVLERSNAFCYTANDAKSKPWMFPGYTYLLYYTSDATDTTEITVEPSSTIDAYSAFTEGYMYYDLYDKVQLHTADNSAADGTNVLLFRNGTVSLKKGNTSLNYFATDDNSIMNILNDSNPCWLYTNSETDSQGHSIATRLENVPYFNRYVIYPSNGYIVNSLDFGRPEEIYIPNAIYREGSTIYEAFWSDYISDLYSKDSRVVRTKMLIKENPSVEWLRRFYAFDGAIWRMTGIYDYNVAAEKLTEVEFVRVQDVRKYTSVPVSEGVSISIELGSYSVPLSGGVVSYTITVPQGVSWRITEYDSGTTLTQTNGVGPYTGYWTIPAYSLDSTKQYSLTAVAGDSSARVYLTQNGIEFSIDIVSGDTIPANGGTAIFRLICPDTSWSAYTDYTGIITAITPSSGIATSQDGVLITASFGMNPDNSERTAYIIVQTSSGATRRSSNIRQNAAGDPYVRLYPPQISAYPYSGGTLDLYVESNTEWLAENNNQNVCHISTTAGTGSQTVQLVVEPNSGASRYGSITFRRVADQGHTAAYLYVFQNAYEEPEPPGEPYFYFGTSASDSATTSGCTVAYYGAGNIIYCRTNADMVYTSISGASWITNVETGRTEAIIYTETNATETQRFGYVKFGLSPQSLDYVLEVTQEAESGTYFRIVSGDNAQIPASGGVWTIVYETNLPQVYYTYNISASGYHSGGTMNLTIGQNTQSSAVWRPIVFKDSPTGTTLGGAMSIQAAGGSVVTGDPRYLTFEIVSGGTWGFDNQTQSAVTLQYSSDSGSSWNTLSLEAGESGATQVAQGVEINVKGNYRNVPFGGALSVIGTAKFNAKGNVLSIAYGDDFANRFELNEGDNFSNLFAYSNVLSAEDLSLQATGLSEYCYYGMFQNSTLTTAPALPATILNDYCYEGMFTGCGSLTTAPNLPATVLSVGCYTRMFALCSSLVNVQASLPATTLPDAGTLYGCYEGMFSTCTSLTTAPALPATTLGTNCYKDMFYGCNLLEFAPDLPAATLKSGCYQEMFRLCSSLISIKCLATDISATNSTDSWLAGVSNTGTFTKRAGMIDWSRDGDGIPEGWSIEEV